MVGAPIRQIEQYCRLGSGRAAGSDGWSTERDAGRAMRGLRPAVASVFQSKLAPEYAGG